MKKLSILLLIIPMLVGCGKFEGNKEKILGTWYENFLDRTDCNSMYTFNSDGTVEITNFTVLGPDEWKAEYRVKGKVITLSSFTNLRSGYTRQDSPQYTVTKLTEKEMDWTLMDAPAEMTGDRERHFER